MDPQQIAEIPESFFQYSATLAKPLFDEWSTPNKIISTVAPPLRSWGVGLGDVSWSQQATNLRDLQVTFAVHRLRSAIRVGLESITFDVANPDWSEAQKLMELFNAVHEALKGNTSFSIAAQEVALAMHIRPLHQDIRLVTGSFVNVDKLGKADVYGVSIYRSGSSCVVDKSLRYEGAYFIRLNRSFDAAVPFSEVALNLYNDEVAALRVLGLADVLETPRAK